MVSDIAKDLNKIWVFHYENLRPVEVDHSNKCYAVDFPQLKGETLTAFTMRITNTITVMSGYFNISSSSFEFNKPMFAVVEFKEK